MSANASTGVTVSHPWGPIRNSSPNCQRGPGSFHWPSGLAQYEPGYANASGYISAGRGVPVTIDWSTACRRSGGRAPARKASGTDRVRSVSQMPSAPSVTPPAGRSIVKARRGEESGDRMPPLRARAVRLLEQHEGQPSGDQRGRHGVVVERHGVGEQGRGEAEAEGQQVRDPRGDGRGLQELAEPDERQARGDPDDSPDEHEVRPHEMRRRAAEAHPRAIEGRVEDRGQGRQDRRLVRVEVRAEPDDVGRAAPRQQRRGLDGQRPPLDDPFGRHVPREHVAAVPRRDRHRQQGHRVERPQEPGAEPMHAAHDDGGRGLSRTAPLSDRLDHVPIHPSSSRRPAGRSPIVPRRRRGVHREHVRSLEGPPAGPGSPCWRSSSSTSGSAATPSGRRSATGSDGPPGRSSWARPSRSIATRRSTPTWGVASSAATSCIAT